MRGKLRQPDATVLKENPLLNYCRQEPPPSGQADLPHPTWTVKSNKRSMILWFPRPEMNKSRPVFEIEAGNRCEWKLTILVWKKMEIISPLEKGYILDYLATETNLKIKTILREYMSLLDLPGGEEWLAAYRFLSQCPRPLQDRFHSGELSAELARYLEPLPVPIREPVIKGLAEEKLYFSVQQLRQLEEGVRRLKPAEQKQAGEQMTHLLKQDVAPKKLGQNLVKKVEKTAYPTLNQKWKEFKKDLEKLELDSRLSIQPPDNFEGDYLDFSFRCHRDENLRGIIDSLEKCEELFDHV